MNIVANDKLLASGMVCALPQCQRGVGCAPLVVFNGLMLHLLGEEPQLSNLLFCDVFWRYIVQQSQHGLAWNGS